MVIENLLEPLGYAVKTCMTGMEALELLKTEPRLPNLVLLDQMMPGMDGYECCRLIRQDFSRSHLPVIMVSAKVETKHVVNGLEAGCNDYVTKVKQR